MHWFSVQVRAELRRLVRPRHDDRAASLVEYALLVALIAVVCVLAVTFFGGETGDSFSRNADSVTNA